MTKFTGLPDHVLVFAPYVETDGKLVSPHYDLPEYRAEIGGWMRALGPTWEWLPVTSRMLAGLVERAANLARTNKVLVVNLCDGTAVDGYPGIEVVESLERRGLAFTGSDSSFYRVTTSKAASKRRLLQAGVATAPFVLLGEIEKDLDRAIREIGFPLFVKPDVSAGSYGIQIDSVVHDRAGALRKVEQLLSGLHGQHFERGAILIEPFIEGREFTVLVAEDAAEPHGLWVLDPCERVFDKRVPPSERFLAFERYWGLPEAERSIPSGEPYYWYARAPEDMREDLADLARRAVRAVGGSSYARVDIRMDEASGRTVVLEVNAQCGLSSDDSSTVGSMLRLNGCEMVEIVERILRHGMTRARRNDAIDRVARA
jgi:D-alanine-D-alanine ligase-like ATP-grasp enzyme